jgi:hypothetical protein
VRALRHCPEQLRLRVGGQQAIGGRGSSTGKDMTRQMKGKGRLADAGRPGEQKGMVEASGMESGRKAPAGALMADQQRVLRRLGNAIDGIVLA